MVNTREIVLELLLEIEKSDVFSNQILRAALDKYDYLEQQDKAFIKRITEGCVERRIQLDYCIDCFSKTPVKKMKPLIRNLLRMSVYQILFMDSVPDSAAVNEAAKLAGKRGFSTLKGFVNGVLRTVSRQKECIPWPDAKVDWKLALSVETSMPLPVIDSLEEDYGREKAVAVARALLDIRPVTVRMKESLSEKTKLEILEKWKEQKIEWQKCPYIPDAYYCKGLNGPSRLYGFAEGMITVQDVSSMMVAHCADIKEENYVLDVCAAPGGKSMHAAEKLHGTGCVEARDVSEAKVQYIEENADRLQYDNVTTRVWDGRITEESSIEKADVLFLDVPCSGFGVMGKKRDIKYHITLEGLAELSQLQKEIVSASWQYVKKGGTLMYSTCTIRKEENEEMSDWIASQFPLKRVSLDAYLPEEMQNNETANGMLQLWPDIHETDGFFIAKFIRE